MADQERLTTQGADSPADALAAPDWSGLVLTDRGFWSLYASAWACYAMLFVFVAMGQGEGFTKALLGGVGYAASPAFPGIVIARRRGSLLRPGLTLRRFFGREALVALPYAFAVAVLNVTIFRALRIDLSGQFGGDPFMTFGAFVTNALFLYIILLAFLVWVESMQRVQESRELIAREAVLRAEAESQALRAQFNPHFVFNTLHSLMLLVRAEPETAERAIEDVAGMIRYASTLQRQEVDQVALAKELEFTRRYLSLERLRFPDRLEVAWTVDEDLHHALVPAFSLQTLVENAVKHGISPKPEGGRIEVRVSGEEGSRLRVVVADDGVGARPNSLGANGGTGLRLLGRRLQSTYGSDASLDWATSPGEGFAVTLRLPIRRDADA